MAVLDATERESKIERYGAAYSMLAGAVQRYPREMWHFKPSDGWSVHEIVVHITDSEANSYVRCRRLIAEPGKDVMAYDESGWAEALHYAERSPEDALELFRLLRLTTYKLIKTLPEVAWLNNTIYHPENGTMTMDDWLDVYERHVPEHIEQMDRALEEWRNGGQ